MSDYKSRPWHFIVPVAFFAAGAKLYFTMEEVYMYIGISFVFASFGSYTTILVNSILPHYTKYWEEVNRFTETISKTNNPDVWRALGYEPPVRAFVTTKEADGDQKFFPHYERKEFPVSDDVLSLMANGFIDGVPFSEGEWVGKRKVISSGKFRKLQDMFRESGYIQLNNKNNSRMGYAFTKKGVSFITGYARLVSQGNSGGTLLSLSESAEQP